MAKNRALRRAEAAAEKKLPEQPKTRNQIVEQMLQDVCDEKADPPNDFVAYLSKQVRERKQAIHSLNENLGQLRAAAAEIEVRLRREEGAHAKSVEDCRVWIEKALLEEDDDGPAEATPAAAPVAAPAEAQPDELPRAADPQPPAAPAAEAKEQALVD